MLNKFAESSPRPNRRDFVRTGAGLTAASLATLTALDARAADAVLASNVKQASVVQPGQTILFQGDSITDAGRKRDHASDANSQPAMGNGYAWLAAAEILVDRPNDKLKFFNRGISGNKVYQLAERWQEECIDLKPDILSILIGVNDYWHLIKHNYEGTLEKYEGDFKALVARTKEALPTVKLVICEPFALKVGSVDETWFPAFDEYRAAAKRIADEAGAVFVPFQTMFDLAIEIAPPERWAADGVHPTPDGAALMAHWWRKAVGA
jgi:lysophospholipase L1-like esterase